MFNKKIQNKMKSNVKFGKAISLAMCMMFALTFFVGCDKDEEVDARDSYTGTWRVTERIVGAGEIDYYNVTITKSAVNKKDIVITNFFGDPAISLLATVDGNSFTIPQQTFGLLGFSGSGRKDGNTLKFSVLANMTGGITLNLDCDASKL